jgi:hypothetical protein
VKKPAVDEAEEIVAVSKSSGFQHAAALAAHPASLGDKSDMRPNVPKKSAVCQYLFSKRL